jgi:endonuclease/exonuclease/phosphatase (EEP) superfamily protein YafD
MIISTFNLQYNSPNPTKNIKNIHDISNTYDIDFYLFQEASIYKYIIPLLPNHKYVVHKSGKEHQITFYSHRYKLLHKIMNEFERGRPYTCLLLQHYKTNEIYIVVNIHAGHHSNYSKHIFDHIIYQLQHFNLPIKNIIIGGDFNVYVKTINIQLNNKLYFLQNKGYMKTCCKNDNYKHNFDYVLTNMKFIKKTMIFDNNGSDHRMVLIELKN